MVSGFFTRKISQVASVGDILEQRRLSLGIAIERVARETSLQGRYIRALELGDAKNLPPEIYVRGFLTTYARYLRVDVKALLEQWDRERGISKSLQESQKRQTLPTFREKKSILPKMKFTPSVVKFGLIGLGVIAVGLYLTLSVTSLARAPELELEEPTSDRSVTDSSIVFVGHTQSSAQLTINDQPVHVSDDGYFRQVLSLQEGINDIEIVASNKLGKESRLTRRIQADLSPISSLNSTTEATPDSDSEATAEDGVSIAVKVNDEATWIEVEADGKIIFDGTLLPQVKKVFEADSEILLTTGKGQYTEVEFAGETVTSLGEGVVRQVSFTPGMTIEDLPIFASR